MSVRVGGGPHKDITLFIISEIHLLGSRSARVFPVPMGHLLIVHEDVMTLPGLVGACILVF